LGTALNVPFGETISNKADVEERLKRAQRAILNPGTNFKNFLDGPDEDPSNPELSFSTNCVGLQISGGDVTDLSFCDLPGRYLPSYFRRLSFVDYLPRSYCKCQQKWEYFRHRTGEELSNGVYFETELSYSVDGGMRK
jgi:hypothetical protein